MRRRILFYSLAGFTAALLGWNVTLLLIVYPINLIIATISQKQIPSNLESFLLSITNVLLPEIILFPLVASFLSVSLILASIYLSNPINNKANKRRRGKYITTSLITGVTAGLFSALITIILYQPAWTSGSIRRVVAWGIIGLGIGVAEGFCWYFLTTEGASSFSLNRLVKSPAFGLLAGFIAALLIEIIRVIIQLGGYEEPLGFMILGICLGLSLTFSTTPAYQVALRAGRGFGMNMQKLENHKKPRINPENSVPLSLIYFDDNNVIEEGLSIQLPTKNKSTIVIGSAEGSHIILPETPAKVATLILENKQWRIKCFVEDKVQIQSRYLLENSRPQLLYHNQILTFYYEKVPDKFYRFIFYDRFLDPST
ncbi:hypothetical protein [Crocosphaera sp. Alani8]|uniref:hypothetical protein n=1 Tax=Crocosphaera sp. Alani8 TaxID=3038952 RepID=UPI00313D7EE9